MKAEYNTLTVDIKKPACKSWTNQYHFVHLFINYATIISYFIKITLSMTHSHSKELNSKAFALLFKSSECVAMDSVISVMAVFFL
jgi:hypothetical protein